MAVDQARHLNLFREMLSTSNNYSNMTNNNNNNPIHQIGNMYSNNSNISNSLPPGAINDSLLLPFYNLNDVVFNSAALGKLPPPVKDDSGVTFNNSLVPPTVTSRKRPREAPFLPPAMVSAAGLPSLLTSNATSMISKESNGFSFLGEDLSLQIMQQQLDLDRLISQHMEKMRMEIEEQKKQQLRRVMAAIETAMAKKMREKDEEIEKMVKINWELEERVKTLCLQNQIWRDLAQTNEATANALRSNLEQVLQQNDAVSCCGSSGEVEAEAEAEEEETRRWRKRTRVAVDGGYGEKWVYRGGNKGGSGSGSESESESEGKNGRMCRKCEERESTVLVLPCRHLCLCTMCGPAVNACPICHSAKTASVHVNLS